MTTEHIHECAPDFSTVLCNHGVHFIKDLLLQISVVVDGWGAMLRITDITNALGRGKVCEKLTVEFKNLAHEDGTALNAVQDFALPYGTDYRRIFNDLLALEWKAGRYGFEQIHGAHRTTSRFQEASIRVASPFAVLPPLKHLPAKWTVAHVIRALWNGQFSGLKRNYAYTDDYAGDAAANFQAGAIANGRVFATRIIESPSGWWASASGERVSICCHSFESNEFTPKLC